MAPEQNAGDPTVDGRVDLYAYGIVAYEMLAGHTPFRGRPGSQVLSAHLTEVPRPLGEVRPELPAALAALVEMLRARATYLARTPDGPDAWYLYGDHHFHYGAALALPGWRGIASAHFRRALELDSGYVPGYAHLIEIAVSEGDDALFTRTSRQRAARDTTRFTARTTHWHRAVRAGDSLTARAIVDSVLAERHGLAFTFADYALTDGYGMASALDLAERSADQSERPELQGGRFRLAAHLLYIAGAPDEAARRLQQAGPPGNPFVLATLVRVGLVGDGDPRLADSAAAELRALDDAPLVGPDSVLIARREATRARAIWRLLRGDTTRTARDLERLRAMNARFRPPVEGIASAPADLHVEVIEALLARVRAGRGGGGAATNADAARLALQAVETRANELDWSAVNPERTVALSLLTARLFEESGDLAAAIRMAGRVAYRNGGELHPYAAVQARTIRRLAELTNDAALAREASARYAQLRVREARTDGNR